MMLHNLAYETRVLPNLCVPEAAGSPALAVGFVPAFRHEDDGQVRLCLLEDGRLSCVHVLDSLPDHWVAERDAEGRPLALVEQVSAGYLRGSEFWTLGDLRRPMLDS